MVPWSAMFMHILLTSNKNKMLFCALCQNVQVEEVFDGLVLSEWPRIFEYTSCGVHD